MTISRHQAGATVAGEKTGGQFKAGSRTNPDGGALGQVMGEQEELAAIAQARWAQYNRLGQMQHAMEVERVRIATEIVSTKVEELFADDQGPEISQIELMASDHDPGSYMFAHLVRANGERVSAGSELQEIGALVNALDFTIAATPVEEDADGRPLTHLFDASLPDAAESNRFMDLENLDEHAFTAAVAAAQRAGVEVGASRTASDFRAEIAGEHGEWFDTLPEYEQAAVIRDAMAEYRDDETLAEFEHDRFRQAVEEAISARS